MVDTHADSGRLAVPRAQVGLEHGSAGSGWLGRLHAGCAGTRAGRRAETEMMRWVVESYGRGLVGRCRSRPELPGPLKGGDLSSPRGGGEMSGDGLVVQGGEPGRKARGWSHSCRVVHTDTWAGSSAVCTTRARSSQTVSRSTASFRWAANAATVWSAS